MRIGCISKQALPCAQWQRGRAAQNPMPDRMLGMAPREWLWPSNLLRAHGQDCTDRGYRYENARAKGTLDCGGSTPPLTSCFGLCCPAALVIVLAVISRRRRAAAVQGASRIFMYSGRQTSQVDRWELAARRSCKSGRSGPGNSIHLLT